ncbi:MAG: hypothetical protein CSA07_04320 [Bacteroidia bacterium]|nr:MAG: hypothetical protein CSA07_04320 [Bacteroidia bacterium]
MLAGAFAIGLSAASCDKDKDNSNTPAASTSGTTGSGADGTSSGGATKPHVKVPTPITEATIVAKWRPSVIHFGKDPSYRVELTQEGVDKWMKETGLDRLTEDMQLIYSPEQGVANFAKSLVYLGTLEFVCTSDKKLTLSNLTGQTVPLVLSWRIDGDGMLVHGPQDLEDITYGPEDSWKGPGAGMGVGFNGILASLAQREATKPLKFTGTDTDEVTLTAEFGLVGILENMLDFAIDAWKYSMDEAEEKWKDTSLAQDVRDKEKAKYEALQKLIEVSKNLYEASGSAPNGSSGSIPATPKRLEFKKMP